MRGKWTTRREVADMRFHPQKRMTCSAKEEIKRETRGDWEAGVKRMMRGERLGESADGERGPASTEE